MATAPSRPRTKLMILFTAGLSVCLALCYTGCLSAADSTMTIHGTGYPPIKALNKRQAFLMAHRAAVLDAYGKILWRRTDHSGAGKKEDFFFHLSGFVRAMTIIDEKLLPDGGVMITATVERPEFVTTNSSTEKTTKKKREGGHQQFAPKIITRQQWFKVISSMVTFNIDNSQKETKQ